MIPLIQTVDGMNAVKMLHDSSAPREFYQCYRYLSAVVQSSHPAATADAKQNAAKQRTHMHLGVCRSDFRLDVWIWSERVTCSLDTGVVTVVYATTRRSYSYYTLRFIAEDFFVRSVYLWSLDVCALTFLRILMKGQVIRRSVSINHKRSGQTINRHLFSWRRVSSRLSLFRVVDMVLSGV